VVINFPITHFFPLLPPRSCWYLRAVYIFVFSVMLGPSRCFYFIYLDQILMFYCWTVSSCARGYANLWDFQLLSFSTSLLHVNLHLSLNPSVRSLRVDISLPLSYMKSFSMGLFNLFSLKENRTKKMATVLSVDVGLKLCTMIATWLEEW
jgi:hypothetical protein